MSVSVWQKENNDLSLLDDEFLATLMEQKERTLFARIASLNIDELPIEFIEGRVTGGSINVDGSSSIRMTCSLTMITENIDINDFYWGIKTKFKLEIGLKNNLTIPLYNPNNTNYPEIVWFPAGTYYITSFNTSLSTNSCTVSISGKDKMCMLNGELGGSLFASIDFGTEEIKNTVFKKVNFDTFADSEILMSNQYYIWLDEYGLLGPSEISVDDPFYAFELDKEGHYYKLESKFIKISDEDTAQKKKYKIYKLVLQPSEMFLWAVPTINPPENLIEQEGQPWLVAGTYEKGKYYYRTGSNGTYYTINNTNLPKYWTSNIPLDIADLNLEGNIINNYLLKDLYEKQYEYTINKIPLTKIIREAVHMYAKEPYHNIIINDLEDYALEQMTYKGDKTLYVLRDQDGNFRQMMFKEKATLLKTFIENNNIILDESLQSVTSSSGTKIVYSDGEWAIRIDENKYYTVAELEYGDDIGYRITDFTYPGDLICSIGESITSVIDKIKNLLGDEYEYFYDLDGRFIFLKKQTYVNTAWSMIENNNDESYVNYMNSSKKFSFNFEGNRLITAILNNPALTNLKNDYSIWGKRKNVSGAEVPIHLRYAIDKKPKEYMAFNGTLYYTKEAVDSPSNQYGETIENAETPTFTRDLSEFPVGILNSDDWWEISEWALYYKTMTGAYPGSEMKEYATEVGFTGTLEFSNGEQVTLRDLLVIDLEKKIISGNLYFVPYYTSKTNNRPLYPFLHKKNNCGHTYEEFLTRLALNEDMVSYVYLPRMPSNEVISQDGGALLDTDKPYAKLVDWRELIYRMAIDYFAGLGCDEDSPIYGYEYSLNELNLWESTVVLVLNNPDGFLSAVAARNQYYYPTGYTGYELYYTDMEGFWRQLYNPEYKIEKLYSDGGYETEYLRLENSSYYVKNKVWTDRWTDERIEDVKILYYVKKSDYWDLENDDWTIQENTITNIHKKLERYCLDDDDEKLYWNTDIFTSPESLNFWIEFLDSGTDLTQYSVLLIGDRLKVVNDDKVTAIFYKEIPEVILYDKTKYEEKMQNLREAIESFSGYTFVFYTLGFSLFINISYRGKSAKDKLDELLYQFSYVPENITITAIPVYHLLPNTRIYVCDKTTGINGEYIVSKVTLPLTYNGTMSITATKAPERLY